MTTFELLRKSIYILKENNIKIFDIAFFKHKKTAILPGNGTNPRTGSRKLDLLETHMMES